MTTIIQNQAASLKETIRSNGIPVDISGATSVTAQLFTIDGVTPLFSPAKTLNTDDTGSDWSNGVVSIALIVADTASAAPPEAMLVIAVDGRPYRFRVNVETAAAPTKSTLFIKDFIINELRDDRLLLAAQSVLPGITVSDDYLWDKVRAAESEIAHTLRVPLVPTTFFPATPTQDQIVALNGMAWAEDPGYDHNVTFFDGDRWGLIATRHKPLISVSSMRFSYPAPANGLFDVPLDWLRIDKKYGHIQLVPTAMSVSFPLASFMLMAAGAGRTIPQMIQLTYVAGIENVSRDYPELLDVIKKTAVLKVIQDAYLPQSGSISADGLSQSISVDMDKYHDSVDTILNGPKGSNGGLMTAIHGIRMTVLGG